MWSKLFLQERRKLHTSFPFEWTDYRGKHPFPTLLLPLCLPEIRQLLQ